MRASRPSLSPHGLGLALRRVGVRLREAALLAGPVAALEAVGPLTLNDGFDLMVLFGVVLVTILLGQALRAGWMPLTQHAAATLRERGRSILRRLSPAYAVALRPTPGIPIHADNTLTTPILTMAGAAIVLAALGALTFTGLTWVKLHVSYTLYLAGLVSIWSTMLLSVLFCGFCMQQWLSRVARRTGGSPAPYLLTFLGWVLGMVALAVLPGAFAVLAVLLIGWFGGRGLQTLPQQNYLFCRRDDHGRARAIPVQTYLRHVHTAMVMALTVVVVISQAQRLWEPWRPQAPFEFTGWMGLMASLASIVLCTLAAAHFRRLVNPGDVPPEVALTPTLWIKRSLLRELGSEEERQETYWYRNARENGWLVLPDAHEPDHAWDLVMGEIAHPRHFEPRDPIDESDASFQIERRLHVVMRRRFRRSFERLFKTLRGESPEGGTGFLFCPHVWLVPGVVRDVAPAERQNASGALVGPTLYGTPYAQAFDPRVRRYIGSILRKLEVDVVFLEDAVTWKDIRRVLGVMYEVHDQGRAPIRERHFVGLPRVRVVIQEEAAESEPPEAIPTRADIDKTDTMPGHTRVLLITRDRGTKDEIEELDPVDHGVKTPSLV
ncbi:MAG: hypothetical protein P1V36_06200 [Planctomycetota bacterium]|nr:hypothetical protein [Planctomycetota bacterium]